MSEKMSEDVSEDMRGELEMVENIECIWMYDVVCAVYEGHKMFDARGVAAVSS